MTIPLKYILINAGTKTRRAFINGLQNTPTEHFASKKILLHIDTKGTPHFIYNNIPISFENARIFTRLRATDQQFCGILYDYLRHNHIAANDPINHSYANSAEKISQMLILAQQGIRIPETFIFREESFASNEKYILEHTAYPLIYKTDGSRGRNVHYIETPEELKNTILNKKPHVLALIQPFIHNEFDTRTIVAFGEVLGTIKRSRTNGYLNNIAQGATASSYTLTEEEIQIAIRASEVCGIDVAGVDMIHTEAGPIVLEVNKSPQIQGFESVHDFKVFTKVAECMHKKFSD